MPLTPVATTGVAPGLGKEKGGVEGGGLAFPPVGAGLGVGLLVVVFVVPPVGVLVFVGVVVAPGAVGLRCGLGPGPGPRRGNCEVPAPG